MTNTKKILIIGANFSNKGAEAMMKTVRQQFIRLYGDVTCYLLCRDYEETLAESEGFIPLFEQASVSKKQWDVFWYRVSGKLYKLVTGSTKPWYFPFPFPEIKRVINQLDAIIDVSGY